MDPLRDRARQSGRSDHSVPVVREHLRIAGLGSGRYLRQGRCPLAAGDDERAQLPGADMREQHGHVEHAELHLAAKQVVDRGRRALVGHVQRVDACLDLEQLHGKVRDAARARRAVIHLAGVRLEVRDQLGERVRLQRPDSPRAPRERAPRW